MKIFFVLFFNLNSIRPQIIEHLKTCLLLSKIKVNHFVTHLLIFQNYCYSISKYKVDIIFKSIFDLKVSFRKNCIKIENYLALRIK
jgi:hypothetical protein